MKVYAEGRVVIELTLEEAKEFYQGHRPQPRTVGKKLDDAVFKALEEQGAFDV